ncbi:hypothetical protein ACFLZE_01330 [Thermodesulfobacteriota bacterium]
MRTKIEKLLMICLMAFGSFLIMMSLVSHNAEAVSEWSIETVDSDGSVGLYSSIAIDSSDNVQISYSDGDNEDLKYTTDASGEWVAETVDSDGSVGWFPSIAIDSNNHPHISYFDDTSCFEKQQGRN